MKEFIKEWFTPVVISLTISMIALTCGIRKAHKEFLEKSDEIIKVEK